jgi:hypothetical protein
VKPAQHLLPAVQIVKTERFQRQLLYFMGTLAIVRPGELMAVKRTAVHHLKPHGARQAMLPSHIPAQAPSVNGAQDDPGGNPSAAQSASVLQSAQAVA